MHLKTPAGALLPKDVKQQIYFISKSPLSQTTKRDDLLPATVMVFKAWEALPLDPVTRQWTIAHARLIGWLLMNGRFQESQAQGLKVTKQEVAEARFWLHKKPDGTISRFGPVRQPWHYKDLHWNSEAAEGGALETIVGTPVEDWLVEVEVAEKDNDNPEALRISAQTLQQPMDIPTKSRETSIGQTTQGEVAETLKGMRNRAIQIRDDAHLPAQDYAEHASEGMNDPSALAQTLSEQSSNANPDASAGASIRSVGHIRQRGPEEDHSDIKSGTSEMQSTSTTGTKRKHDLFEKTLEGQSRSWRTDKVEGLTADTPMQTGVLTPQKHYVRGTQSNNEDSLFVSEGEGEGSDIRGKTQEKPWNFGAQHRARVYQSLGNGLEGNSSGVHFNEHMNGDDDTDTAGGVYVGHGRRSAPSMSFSLSRGAESRYAEDDMETEAVSFVVDPDMTLGELMAFRDQENRKRLGNDGTGESEATTEILDNYDAEMSASGGDFYHEMDKENRPSSGTTNSLHNDGEDRLEVRVIKDEDVSEDELTAVPNTDMINN
ncbi:MAG: hypothetical protein Q9213_003642 [Squamulea squamosa]